MTTHLVTFATKDMERSSWLCAESSKRYGVRTRARFNPSNISSFPEAKENPNLFSSDVRGYGYWAWKPLIIKQELEWLPDGSTLVYSDAGIEFIDNLNYIIDRMDQDVFLFGNQWEHAHWCKRGIIEAIWPVEYKGRRIEAGDATWSDFSKQVQASVIFFRVNDTTRAFVKEWLYWCLFEGGRLVDDSPSRTPNHPEFRENRHDQAILTTMAYRDGYRLHWWAAVYNKGSSPEFVYPKDGYEADDYPPLFSHHRRRNAEWGDWPLRHQEISIGV